MMCGVVQCGVVCASVVYVVWCSVVYLVWSVVWLPKNW